MADTEETITDQSSAKRYIIIDTNLFDSLSIPDLSPQIFKLLEDLKDLDYGLAICDMVIFELLQETNAKKEAKLMDTIRNLFSFYLTQDIMLAAAQLSSLYKDEELPLTQFSTGDRIIAATAVIHNALILTKNGRDFPEPFFKEIERIHLDYKKGGNSQCTYLYFKEPQLDVIARQHSIRTNSK